MNTQNIFLNRPNSFRYGYAAFFDNVANFYDPTASDSDFYDHREFTAGFDVAYLETQSWWNSQAEIKVEVK
jgi:hypothetical protein